MTRATRLMMGMPITVEVVSPAPAALVEDVFAHFAEVDARFSVYKADSEISAINSGRVGLGEVSEPMREVFALAEKTRRDSDGYFDIRRPQGGLDPSGIVKGWAILNAARILQRAGVVNYFVDAGGDIQCAGKNALNEPWIIGVRNPFDALTVIKRIAPDGRGVATSGTSARGQHIYDPKRPERTIDDVVSITVIGPDVLEADRFATAAFAMGRAGLAFIDRLGGFEGYLVGSDRRAVWTRGFGGFVAP